MLQDHTSSTYPIPITSRPLKVLLAGDGYLFHSLLKGFLAAQQSPYDLPIQLVATFRWCHRKKKGVKPTPPEAVEHLNSQWLKRLKTPDIKGLSGMNSPGFQQVLAQYRPDIILVGSWGEILKVNILEYCIPGHSVPIPIINCHPSLLPSHRGANPYASAIRAGETESGVSFHLMEPAIDTGAILYQEPVPIEVSDSGSELRSRCMSKAEEMIPELFKRIMGISPCTPRPQLPSEGTYFPRITMQDALIRWEEDSPQQILNHIRGLQPWLDSLTFLEAALPVMVKKAKLQTVRPIRPNDSPPLPPGTLLAYHQNKLIITTNQEDQRIVIEEFQIYGLFAPLPRWFSIWYFKLRLRPGLRFYSQWQRYGF